VIILMLMSTFQDSCPGTWPQPSLAWPDPIPHQGKGLGHGHRAVSRPTPWNVYQSHHSIQSHDTWSMWSMQTFKFQFE